MFSFVLFLDVVIGSSVTCIALKIEMPVGLTASCFTVNSGQFVHTAM